MVRIIRDLQLGKDGFFTRKLNNCLIKSQYKFTRSHVIRPSEIGGCTRKIVSSILGIGSDELVTPQQQRIFDNGNYVHKRYLKSYIPRIGCVAKVKDIDGKIKEFIDFPIENKEYWLKGKPDAIIFNDENGLPYIFELKSIKQELFIGLQQPDPSYIAQVHIYMFLTNIPRAIVFYENKNTQDIKEFEILKDQNLLDSLLLKIKLIQKYVLEYSETNQLPECTCEYASCKI
jgi:hypothetical protein